MIKASVSLQNPRRRLYIKAKSELEWRLSGPCTHVCKLETREEAYKKAVYDKAQKAGAGTMQKCKLIMLHGNFNCRRRL